MKTSTRFLNGILIIAVSTLSQLSKAQIVYTDVNPDATKLAQIFKLLIAVILFSWI
ncbi:MAG: hypothetical protein H0W62_01410 [Chitinophagales bacterium]|nr:hypothetical protein [Chitinophagales bacterium]